jgi:hypothetical protein
VLAKVSQERGSPDWYPVENQCWRCVADPWVHVSGSTRPVAARWMRSSPTAAAASRPSAMSLGVISLTRPVSTAFAAHTPA